MCIWLGSAHHIVCHPSKIHLYLTAQNTFMEPSRWKYDLYCKLYRFARFGSMRQRFPKTTLRNWLKKELATDHVTEKNWDWLGLVPYKVEETDYYMMLNLNYWGQRVSYVSKRYYEYAIMSFLKKHIQPGDVFIDIGANIGFYTLFAAAKVGPKGRVLAFEANPIAFDILKGHVDVNRIKNTELYACALFDRTSTIDLKVENEGGKSSVRSSADFGEVVNVPAERFDTLVTDIPSNARGVCKIDVEGAEMNVLKGMTDFINTHPNIAYIIEISPSWLEEFGYSVADLVNMFKPLGFKFYEAVGIEGDLREHKGEITNNQDNFIIMR